MRMLFTAHAHACDLLRRCEHHMGRAAFPKLIRPHSSVPGCAIFGAHLSSVSASMARAPPWPVRIRKCRTQDAKKRRTGGSLACSFISVRPCSVTQRYSVDFANGHITILTAHALLTVWHATRRPRLFGRIVPRCCSIASSTARIAVQRRGGR